MGELPLSLPISLTGSGPGAPVLSTLLPELSPEGGEQEGEWKGLRVPCPAAWGGYTGGRPTFPEGREQAALGLSTLGIPQSPQPHAALRTRLYWMAPEMDGSQSGTGGKAGSRPSASSWSQARCRSLHPGAPRAEPSASTHSWRVGIAVPGEKGVQAPLLLPPGLLCWTGPSPRASPRALQAARPLEGSRSRSLGLSPSPRGAVPPAASWPPGRPAPWLLSSGSEPRTPTCS